MKIFKYLIYVFALGALLLAACAQPEQPPTPTPTLPPIATVDHAGLPILARLDIPYGSHERQKLDVLYEEGLVEAPIIVLIHGGGWTSGDKVDMHISSLYAPTGIAQYFVELGFVVVTPNYRLVTRDGENAFPAPVNDVGCAAAWMMQNATKFGGDPSTMFVMGYSAGAHIGAMLAYNSERDWLEECPIQDEEITFKGFIGLAGAYDFAAMTRARYYETCWMLSDLMDLDEDSRSECFDADPDKWAEANPVDHVSLGDPPALLVTGDHDCFINIPDPETGQCMAQTEHLAAALEELGIRADVLILEDIGHGPRGVKDVSFIGEAIIEFLE